MRLINVDDLNKPVYAEEDNITGSCMSYDEIVGYNDGIDAAWAEIMRAPIIDTESKKFYIYLDQEKSELILRIAEAPKEEAE